MKELLPSHHWYGLPQRNYWSNRQTGGLTDYLIVIMHIVSVNIIDIVPSKQYP